MWWERPPTSGRQEYPTRASSGKRARMRATSTRRRACTVIAFTACPRPVYQLVGKVSKHPMMAVNCPMTLFWSDQIGGNNLRITQGMARMRGGRMRAAARAVVIGGGVAGASIAYHLARLGWSEVLLIEQHELAEGTTWH